VHDVFTVDNIFLLIIVQDDAISKPFRVPDLLPKMDELVRQYRS
jgi:hypothetical protein